MIKIVRKLEKFLSNVEIYFWCVGAAKPKTFCSFNVYNFLILTICLTNRCIISIVFIFFIHHSSFVVAVVVWVLSLTKNKFSQHFCNRSDIDKWKSNIKEMKFESKVVFLLLLLLKVVGLDRFSFFCFRFG